MKSRSAHLLLTWVWFGMTPMVTAQDSTPAKTGNGTNVLFIVCDDLNTHVAPSGYDPIQTPTLAGLAAESMTFRWAYCQYPVCRPSRASFRSGLYAQSTGVLNNSEDIRDERPETLSMPQFFKVHGYWTASVGKVFHSPCHEQGEASSHEFLRFDNDELPIVREAREVFEAEHGSIEKGSNAANGSNASRRCPPASTHRHRPVTDAAV